MSKKVLIADDDESILEVMEIVLTGAGHTVLKTNTSEGIVKQAIEQLPDIILMDISLAQPHVDVLGHTLKSDERTRHIPLIFVSGNIDITDVAEASQADGYLEKPFEITQLLETIDKYSVS